MQDSRAHSRLLDIDPITGVRRVFHWHPDTQSFTIETVYDNEDVVEANKVLHNASTGANWKGDMHRVASVPMAIWHDLKKRGILQDQTKLEQWLNDPDNRFFRTREGRV